MKTHQGPPLSQPINRKLQRVTNVMVQLENVTRLLHVLIFSHVCINYSIKSGKSGQIIQAGFKQLSS